MLFSNFHLAQKSHLQPSDLAKTFSEFVLEARRLQLKYKSKITLLVGLESENITDSSTSEIIDLVSKHDLDYVVGSVHHVHETPIDFDRETFEIALSKSSPNYPLSDDSVSDNASSNDPLSSHPKSPEESLFISYFDSQYQILQHLKPMIVGHFDVIRIYRPKYKLTDLIWQRIERNVEFVIGYGGLFEINSAGFKYFDDAYPLRDIFELIIRKGGKFTISDDSHGPSMVGRNYDKLYSYLKEFNINTLYYLDFNENSEEVNTDVSVKKIVVKEINHVLELPFWEQFLEKES